MLGNAPSIAAGDLGTQTIGLREANRSFSPAFPDCSNLIDGKGRQDWVMLGELRARSNEIR